MKIHRYRIYYTVFRFDETPVDKVTAVVGYCEEQAVALLKLYMKYRREDFEITEIRLIPFKKTSMFENKESYEKYLKEQFQMQIYAFPEYDWITFFKKKGIKDVYRVKEYED